MSYPRRLFSLVAAILALLLVPGALFALVDSGPEYRVATAQHEFNPLAAAFTDGSFVVAWTQGGPSSNVIHARFHAASGAPASAEFRLGQPAPELLLDGVAVTTDGAFVVVWEQGRPKNRFLTNVFARKFDRRGKPLTPAFVVHEGSPYSRYSGAVAGTADGGFVVAWAAVNPPSPQFGIFTTDAIARFFRANGTAAGPAIRLTGPVFDPAADSAIVPTAIAVAPDGSVTIVSNCFCDQPGLLLQRFRSDGVVFDDIDPASGCACRGDLTIFPSLSMAPDGSFVVAWVNGVGLVSTNPDDSFPTVVRARRFAADGSALGDVFQVNQGDRLTREPQVAMLADGGFVIGWTDQDGLDGDHSGVFARAYDANGDTSGPDLQLNQRSAGNQILTSIAAAGSRAIAVWQDAGTRVYVRILAQH